MINGFVFASLSNSKNATTVTTYNCVCFFFGKNLNIFNLIFLFFNCHSRVSSSIWLYAIFCLLSSFCVCTLAINIFSNFYLAERLCEIFFHLYTMSTQRTFAELLNKFDLFIRVTCCVFIRFGSCFSFMLWTFAFFSGHISVFICFSNCFASRQRKKRMRQKTWTLWEPLFSTDTLKPVCIKTNISEKNLASKKVLSMVRLHLCTITDQLIDSLIKWWPIKNLNKTLFHYFLFTIWLNLASARQMQFHKQFVVTFSTNWVSNQPLKIAFYF